MELLVCFKVVPDLDQLPRQGWSADSRLTVETSFVRQMINPYDESALELALKYSEQAAGRVGLTALTMGGPAADRYLKMLYALRFVRAVRMETEEDLRFSPGLVAAAVAGFAAENHYDAILMGRQSLEGDNAMTPLLLAEMLNWPCVTGVARLEPGEAGFLRVTGAVDGGTLFQAVRTPCVLAVGNAPGTFLRVPTMVDKVTHGKKAVEVLVMENYTRGAPDAFWAAFRLQGLEPIRRRREGKIIEGATAAEKARVFYESYLKVWLGH